MQNGAARWCMGKTVQNGAEPVIMAQNSQYVLYQDNLYCTGKICTVQGQFQPNAEYTVLDNKLFCTLYNLNYHRIFIFFNITSKSKQGFIFTIHSIRGMRLNFQWDYCGNHYHNDYLKSNNMLIMTQLKM